MTEREAFATLINGGMIMDSWSYFYRIEDIYLCRYNDPNSEATRSSVRSMKAPARIVKEGKREELLSEPSHNVNQNSYIYKNMKLLLDGHKLKFDSGVYVKLGSDGYLIGNRINKSYLRSAILCGLGRVIKERKSK